MHRHGYQGRKFNRERDQRNALVKSLADSLILHTSIQTTLPKAKEVVPYVEKLITKAKIGDLHNRRQIISSLMTLESAHKLVDELAPQMKSRTSGHLRIEKILAPRRGDNAPLARVSFVDDFTAQAEATAVISNKQQAASEKPATKAKKVLEKAS